MKLDQKDETGVKHHLFDKWQQEWLHMTTKALLLWSIIAADLQLHVPASDKEGPNLHSTCSSTGSNFLLYQFLAPMVI